MASFIAGALASTYIGKLFSRKKSGTPPPAGISQADFDRAVDRIKAEHEKDRIQWQQDSVKSQAEIENRYKQHEAEQINKYENELKTREKKLNNMHLSAQLNERLKDEQHYIDSIGKLLQQRSIYIEKGNKIYLDLSKINNEYNSVSGRIAVENELIQKFDFERNSQHNKLLVTLGGTGVGKSTFCNRIIGDRSQFGNNNQCVVGSGTRSCTQYIKKYSITGIRGMSGEVGMNSVSGMNNNNYNSNNSNDSSKDTNGNDGSGNIMDSFSFNNNDTDSGNNCSNNYDYAGSNGSNNISSKNNNGNGNYVNCGNVTIVDTPGGNDSEGKDFEHSNNLCAYLRGCGGVNAFLVFFSCAEPRLAIWYQNLLKHYQDMLGKDFWKHVIIVATKADIQNNTDYYSPQFKQELQNTIKSKMGLNIDLPVIVMGHDSYEKSLNSLFNIIPNNKYNCETIISPIDKLRDEANGLLLKKLNFEDELQSVFSKCGEIDGTIKSINASLIENDKQIRNLQQWLGKPVRNMVKYDYDAKLPSLKKFFNYQFPNGNNSNNSNNHHNNVGMGNFQNSNYNNKFKHDNSNYNNSNCDSYNNNNHSMYGNSGSKNTPGYGGYNNGCNNNYENECKMGSNANYMSNEDLQLRLALAMSEADANDGCTTYTTGNGYSNNNYNPNNNGNYNSYNNSYNNGYNNNNNNCNKSGSVTDFGGGSSFGAKPQGFDTPGNDNVNDLSNHWNNNNSNSSGNVVNSNMTDMLSNLQLSEKEIEYNMKQLEDLYKD